MSETFMQNCKQSVIKKNNQQNFQKTLKFIPFNAFGSTTEKIDN